MLKNDIDISANKISHLLTSKGEVTIRKIK